MIFLVLILPTDQFRFIYYETKLGFLLAGV